MNRTERLKETIVYGGAFNPPTRAHQAILQACIDYADPRQADVWLIPSGTRLDKTIETPYERRVGMCQALIADVMQRTVQVSVNMSELERDYQTETFDTVMEMAETHPDREFAWVFGSDSVATMESWKGGEWMLDNLRMLIIERPGTPVRALGRNAAVLSVATGEVSSTRVRERLAARETVSDLVPPSVERLLLAGI